MRKPHVLEYFVSEKSITAKFTEITQARDNPLPPGAKI